jgi:hypothetical protein
MAAVKNPPYEAYAAIVGVFVGGLGAAGLLARVFDRNPACQTPLDFGVLSLASFKAARTLADDEVTSFLRDPFVKGEAHEGDEVPVESGDYRQAIGELVTCSRCGGTWRQRRLRPRRSSRRGSGGCSPGRSRQPGSTTGCRPGSRR